MFEYDESNETLTLNGKPLPGLKRADFHALRACAKNGLRIRSAAGLEPGDVAVVVGAPAPYASSMGGVIALKSGERITGRATIDEALRSGAILVLAGDEDDGLFARADAEQREFVEQLHHASARANRETLPAPSRGLTAAGSPQRRVSP